MEKGAGGLGGWVGLACKPPRLDWVVWGESPLQDSEPNKKEHSHFWHTGCNSDSTCNVSRRHEKRKRKAFRSPPHQSSQYLSSPPFFLLIFDFFSFKVSYSPDVSQVLYDHHNEAQNWVIKQECAHEGHCYRNEHDACGDDTARVGHLRTMKVYIWEERDGQGKTGTKVSQR